MSLLVLSISPWKTFLGNLYSKFIRDGDRLLQLLIVNEEFLVIVYHQCTMIQSLPFVHTAPRSYRLEVPVKTPDEDDIAWATEFSSTEAV